MSEKKKLSTKIKNYQAKEKKQRKELLEVIEKEIDQSKQPKEVVIEKADFVEAKSDKKTATKMVAERAWGIKKEEGNVNKRQKIFKTIFKKSIFICKRFYCIKKPKYHFDKAIFGACITVGINKTQK